MRILSLDLVRFGPFDGRVLSFGDGDGSGLHLVHGPNEAGKTSALRAIRALLFGLPTRASHLAHGFEQIELKVGGTVMFADGVRAEIVRTKGGRKRSGVDETLQGRVLSGGDSIDDEWLRQRLGRPNEELYSQVFAFSLDALARGAEGLSNEVVRGAIYGAGLGGAVRTGDLLGALEDERDRLFKPLGRETALNSAPRRLDELKRKVQEAVRGSDAYRQLLGHIDEARARAESKELEVVRAQQEVTNLETVKDALAVAARRDADRRELQTLDVPQAFDAELGALTLQALDVVRRVGPEVAAADERLAAFDRELASLPQVPALAAEATLVRRLAEAREPQRTHRDELAALAEDERREAQRTRLDLARLGPSWTLERLQTASFPEPHVRALTKLLEEDRSLTDTWAQTERDLAAADAGIAREVDDARELTAAESPEPVAGLEAWLTHGLVVAATAPARTEAEETLMNLRARTERARLQLVPAPALNVLADESSVTPPTTERIESERLAAQDRATKRSRLEEQLRDADGRVALATAELDALEADAHAPSEAELATARETRQTTWNALTLAWSTGRASVEELAELRREYETRVALADRLADELRWRADEVHARATRVTARAHASAQGAGVRTALERLAAEDETARRAWTEAWSVCGLVPRTPEVMRDWRSHWQSYVELRAQMGPAEARARRFRDDENAFLEEGRTLLHGDGARDAPAEALRLRTATLGTLRAHAEARVARARTLAAQHAEHRRAELEHRRLRDRAAQRRDQALRDRAAWSEAWQRALEAIGLESTLTSDDVRVLLDPLVKLHREHVGATARRAARRSELEASVGSYDREVRERLLPFDTGGPSGAQAANDTLAIVERVHAAFVAADDAARRHTETARVRAEVERKRASEAAQLATAHKQLEGAQRALGGDVDDPTLRRTAERSRPAAELRARIHAAEAELARLRGDRAPEAFASELAARSTAEVDEARSAVENGLTLLRREQATLREEVGMLSQKRQAFDGGSGGADREADLASERAKVRADVETYAVAALAHEILQRSIRRFERENKPRLLARAEELFRIMTDGAFVSLGQDFDQMLIVERPNGRKLRPDELSTGTAEQLFLALRLAYIEAYTKPGVEPLPVVLDDVLVNFDDARALATLRALVEFARGTQVLFFTCHAHVVQLVTDAALGVPVVELRPRDGGGAQAAPGSPAAKRGRKR